MEMENISIKMEVCIMECGRIIECMVGEYYTIFQESLPMMVNGNKINFTEKV